MQGWNLLVKDICLECWMIMGYITTFGVKSFSERDPLWEIRERRLHH
jgi:hypothetical protein